VTVPLVSAVLPH